ncbi:hypothetical protein GR702_01580 [Novosphingobium sp. FGD1]|jgi:hypothetical protein|uniref:Uncharacterized protein n=1 Tax=Novosphingobium silvae TaxID=2692619 RepID=A0A7X4GD62_9SPHN|nr:hypothetical protein [Novosphingobium silvae]MYL96465.1 hypothetical protein [Novosphingobium silvae]
MVIGIISLAGALVAASADQRVANQLFQRIATARVSATSNEPLYQAVTLDVAPDGKITACDPGEGQGDTANLGKICSMTLGIRFIAAKIEGKPSYGRIRTIITVYSPPMDKPQIELRPEQVLSVNRLPNGKNGTLDIKTNLLISATGLVDRCEAGNDEPQAYANVACAQMVGVTAPVLIDRSGAAVSYVKEVHTRFVKEGD